jgi:hypothetical protein
VQQLALFGSPVLLEGEDAATYKALRARIYAAINPVDINDKFFVDDLISLEWEVLRWRRLKWSLIKTRGYAVLRDHLSRLLDRDLSQEEIAFFIEECRLKEADIRKAAQKKNQGEELAQRYRQHDPVAVRIVDTMLACEGRTVDSLMAEALADNLDDIERIDRLATIAETRRNACLREIDRRRAVLGEERRLSAQEVEDAEFEVIEPAPTKGKSAA